MKKTIAIVLFITIIVYAIPIYAAELADPVFESATVTLSTAKKATIVLDTRTVVPSIEIKKCWIQREESGSWSDKCEFTYTTFIVTNTATYSKTIDYSSYITLSGKYRIKCTAEALGHSITIYSTPRTF